MVNFNISINVIVEELRKMKTNSMTKESLLQFILNYLTKKNLNTITPILPTTKGNERLKIEQEKLTYDVDMRNKKRKEQADKDQAIIDKRNIEYNNIDASQALKQLQKEKEELLLKQQQALKEKQDLELKAVIHKVVQNVSNNNPVVVAPKNLNKLEQYMCNNNYDIHDMTD